MILFATLLLMACKNETKEASEPKQEVSEISQKLAKYTDFTLSADLSHLSDNQKEIVKILIEAAKIMDDLFWYEAYGDKAAFLKDITDAKVKQFATYNYGPWDRLDGNSPFVEGVGAKPAGANFYPEDMTKEEFEAAELEHGKNLYTFIRRDEAGKLKTVWYHEQFENTGDSSC